MMSFSKNSNFNEKANFTEVTFGENKPVLEVELNELQDIQNQHRKDLIRDIVLNGFTKLTNIDVSKNEVKFLEESVVYVKGYRVVIPKDTTLELPNINTKKRNATITINNIYLEVWEEQVLSSDTLTEYGGKNNNEIPNHIIDSRYNVETTRRVGVKYSIVVGDGAELLSLDEANDGIYEYEKDGKTIYVMPLVSITRDSNSVNYADLRNLIQTSANAVKIDTNSQSINDILNELLKCLKSDGSVVSHGNQRIQGDWKGIEIADTNGNGLISFRSNPSGKLDIQYGNLDEGGNLINNKVVMSVNETGLLAGSALSNDLGSKECAWKDIWVGSILKEYSCGYARLTNGLLLIWGQVENVPGEDSAKFDFPCWVDGIIAFGLTGRWMHDHNHYWTTGATDYHTHLYVMKHNNTHISDACSIMLLCDV